MAGREEAHSLRTLTERQASAVLGVDPLQLRLAAAEMRLGKYDPVTHIPFFKLEEVAQLAARLVAEGWRERLAALQMGGPAALPEPNGE